MSFKKETPQNETPVKLSRDQYEHWSEMSWRLEVEKNISDTKLKNQAINKESWYKAFFLAGQFNHIKNTDEAVNFAKIIHDFLKTEEVEYKEPQKPIKLEKA